MTIESHSLEDLKALTRMIMQDMNWESFHKPSALAVSASIELCELLKRFQWLSHEEIADLLKNETYRESIADEIADVIVYMLRIADTTGIEPTSAILQKLKKNEEKYPVDVWRGKIPDKIRKKKLMTR